MIIVHIDFSLKRILTDLNESFQKKEIQYKMH